jgi:multiple sugar transport system substrate-binding protein
MYRLSRFAAVLLTVALTLAGCGTTPAAPGSTAAAPAPGSAATPAAPASTAASEPAATPTAQALSETVVFWTTYNTVSPEFETLQNEVIPNFNKHYPNISVQAQALPYDETRQKLLASVAGGEAPDLVRADIAWVPELAAIGALAPLSEIMPDFDTYKANMFEGPLATNFYGGKYYGLPLDTNTRVMFGNQALMQQAGIAEMPVTFDELKQACAKIKALGQADTYCFADGGTYAWAIAPWIWSLGGDITDTTFSKASGFMNSTGTVKAAELLRDMLKDGTLSPAMVGASDQGANDSFAQNKVAFILDGPWAIPSFEKQFPDLKFKTAIFPAGPAGLSSSVIGGENIVVTEGSKNKDAALAFLRYLISEEAQIAMAKTGQMPVLKALSGNSAMPKYFPIFQMQLKTAKPRTPHPAWPKVEEQLTNAFLQVLRGEKEPQAALDEAAAVSDELLAGTKK